MSINLAGTAPAVFINCKCVTALPIKSQCPSVTVKKIWNH